ncbi:hypothetical protein [Algisphaera agarilytica]|uniref:Uncharacterized protein n=1 Tax=Algisphaera agarilytica TaxID=1385975 RepID=A0A7X0H7F4_9BACT|nr:hypothetical protein [Algisphaera agarilytica]MBB6430498.1 hypothetical protein [Algisphaera agarilytica]
MNPLKKLPSLGTVSAGPSRVWVLLLMLSNTAVIIAAVLLLPYLVIIRSAWSKSTGRGWRVFVMVPVFAAAALAIACSPLFIPTGTPLRLPTQDAFGIGPDPLLVTTIMILNDGMIIGLGLFPLSLASMRINRMNRNRQQA